MVLEFRVRNYRSIKDEIILDLRAAEINTASAKRLVNNTMPFDNIRVLKSVGIYGANASGKSNILRAMDFFVRMIRDSGAHNEVDNLNLDPFKFDGLASKPSEFGIAFVVDEVEYDYSIVLNKQGIVSEKLEHYPNNKVAKVFHRYEMNNAIDPFNNYSFGRGKIRRPIDVVQSTHKKTLFLTRAALMNREIPKALFEYFHNNFLLNIEILATPGNRDYIMRNKDLLLELLSVADSDIIDFDIELITLGKVKQKISYDEKEVEEEGEYSKFQITSYHKSNPNIPFDFAKEESSGTLKLFSLAIAILDTIRRNRLVIIDELEKHMHPLISMLLVKMFHGKGKGQLIFSTHQSSILSLDLMRKDQIWFVKKRPNSSSELYSLFDFKDFRDNMNLEKAYFEGRFDSIPVLDDSQQNLDSKIFGNGEE